MTVPELMMLPALVFVMDSTFTKPGLVMSAP
jgi:hypothetical protein